MQIRCKSCGQLLYVSDSNEPQTVRCPACGTVEELQVASDKESCELREGTVRSEKREARSETTQNAVEANSCGNISTRNSQLATCNFYHFPRTVKITRLSTWEVFLMSYRLYAQHFWTSLLLALLMFLPMFCGYWAECKLVPEVIKLQTQLSQQKEQSLQDVWKAYSEIGEQISPQIALMIVALSVVQSLLLLVFTIGGIRLFNAYVRNQQASRLLLLSGFDSFGRILFTFLILVFLQIGIGILSVFVAIPFLFVRLSTIGVLVLFSVFLLSIAFLFFVVPLISDSNVTVLNAFRISFLIARRNIGPLMGLEAMIFLMLFIFHGFASMLFGMWLLPTLVGMIGNALFSPLLIIIFSVAYCKEIEN